MIGSWTASDRMFCKKISYISFYMTSDQDKLYIKIIKFKENSNFAVDNFQFEMVYMYKYSIYVIKSNLRWLYRM